MATFENRVSGDGEPAILAVSERYTGIWGESHGGSGVYGRSPGWHGVFGESDTNTGVLGTSKTLFGVHGVSTSSTGSLGESEAGFGVHGTSKSNTGMLGQSETGFGVHGTSKSNTAIVGQSETGFGVHGTSESNTGIVGQSGSGVGIEGGSKQGDGVVGRGRRGVVGTSETVQGVGIYATNTAGGNAALFEGNVTVTGDLFLPGADVAEEFTVVEDMLPGTVAVLDREGNLTPCEQAYDTRVAGIISGAGDRVPALVLDRQVDRGRRRPLAVTGKAWCVADARQHPIEVGDLLTTAAQRGHAMPVTDRGQAVGAIIGKALTPLREGQGPVLVLVGLG